MSDQNSDLSGITQFFCHLVQNNWFNVNMPRSNNRVKHKSTIVTRQKKLNSYLSTTMIQDRCSVSKYVNTDHCCLFTILLMKFKQKYDQILEINNSFNVKNDCSIVTHYGNTINQKIYISLLDISGKVCFICTTRNLACHTAFTAQVIVLCCQVLKSNNNITWNNTKTNETTKKQNKYHKQHTT